MRSFLTLLVFVFLGYGVYWLVSDSPWPFAGEADSNIEQAEKDPEQSEMQKQLAQIDDGNKKSTPIEITPSREKQLRASIGDAKSPEEADRYRIELAKLLAIKSGGSQKQEAVQILRSVYDARSEASTQAAAFLLAVDDDPEQQLSYASYVLQHGSSPIAEAKARFVKGAAIAQAPEDSKQLEAWQLLSDAYFADEDEERRAEIRKILNPLVSKLLLSPQRTKAATVYNVERGDSLSRIARRYKVTVESLRLVNRLSSDNLQIGQSLKILTGVVQVEIDKSSFVLDLKLDGKFLYSANVGLGKHGKTPLGQFEVSLRQVHPDWHPTGLPVVPYGDPENPLGDYWMGFVDTPQYKGFGIHGTKDPESIGTNASNGCVRLNNEDLNHVYPLVGVGCQVFIRE